LHHPHPRILELPDESLEEVGLGHEVGIEDRDQLPTCGVEAVVESAGLEARAIRATDVVRVDTSCDQTLDGFGRQTCGLVGGVVEHLDLEPIRGVSQLADPFDQALDDRPLVVDRQPRYSTGSRSAIATSRRLA
jgi:hypothetical protein